LGFSAVSTLFGMRALIRFDQTAGRIDSVPAYWPVSSAIPRLTGREELLAFVHPFCSCTVATLNELAQIPTRRKTAAGSPTITAVFFRPKRSGWLPNALWTQALQIGARTLWDDDGVEARRFGARTSGSIFLYSSKGRLLFNGGVTGSRGHEGDNYGVAELVAALDSGRPARARTFVFGCALGLLDP
jgi:hypothetical protein